eukprot:768075-Hanusia_phi.AAC.1
MMHYARLYNLVPENQPEQANRQINHHPELSTNTIAREAFERYQPFFNRIAVMAALNPRPEDLLLDLELDYFDRSVIEDLETSNWSIRDAIAAIVRDGERDLRSVAQAVDDNSKKMLELLLKEIKEEEASLASRGDDQLFKNPTKRKMFAKYDRVLQTLGWLISSDESEQTRQDREMLMKLVEPHLVRDGPGVMAFVRELLVSRQAAENMIAGLPGAEADLAQKLLEYVDEGTSERSRKRSEHNLE